MLCLDWPSRHGHRCHVRTDRHRHKGYPSKWMPLSRALPTCFLDRCTPAVDHRHGSEMFMTFTIYCTP